MTGFPSRLHNNWSDCKSMNESWKRTSDCIVHFRLCRDTMKTPILNWNKKCCLLRCGICAETCYNGSVPGWTWTRNRLGTLDRLLTLHVSVTPPLEIFNVTAGNAHSHTSLPCAESCTVNTSAQDSKHDSAVDPHIRCEEGLCTGWYTICCVVLPLTVLLKSRAVYWVNLAVITSIDQMAWNYGQYYYAQFTDTVKHILKDIFICIIKEQCCEQEESKSTWSKGSQMNPKHWLNYTKWFQNAGTPGAKWASTECWWYLVIYLE